MNKYVILSYFVGAIPCGCPYDKIFDSILLGQPQGLPLHYFFVTIAKERSDNSL